MGLCASHSAEKLLCLHRARTSADHVRKRREPPLVSDLGYPELAINVERHEKSAMVCSQSALLAQPQKERAHTLLIPKNEAFNQVCLLISKRVPGKLISLKVTFAPSNLP